MAEIFDFFTKNKFCKETRQMSEDEKSWKQSWEIIKKDIEMLSKNKCMAYAIVVGMKEFGVMHRIASKESGRAIYPKTINSIPLILISTDSYCEVIPSSDDLYRALSD